MFLLPGNFDPKAMSNFYDNIEPGPVVPPKPCKKGESLNKGQENHSYISLLFSSSHIEKEIFHELQ